MQITTVEVLDSTGAVITVLQSGSAVEAVKNITAGSKMRVGTDNGIIDIVASYCHVPYFTICLQLQRNGVNSGFYPVEDFIKEYM